MSRTGAAPTRLASSIRLLRKHSKGNHMRLRALVGLFVSTCFIVAAAAQSTPPPKEVKIDNFTFGPAEVTVPVGATVTWTNRDDIPHTVVSSDKVFKSKVMESDDKYS